MKRGNQTVPHRGFTMLEVLAVLAVLAVLLTIAIPAYQKYATRASVAGALAMADAARIEVELALLEERPPVLPASGDGAVTALAWVPATGSNPPPAFVGAIVPSMQIVGPGNVSALALQRYPDGTWTCANAAMVGRTDALGDEFLPEICRGAGSRMGTVQGLAKCASGQEQVSLTIGGVATPACVSPCAAGMTRSLGNPTQCKAPPACTAAEHRKPSGECAPIPAKPTCNQGQEAVLVEDENYNPGWGCMVACQPGQTRVGFACKGTPAATAQTLPANPPPAGAGNAGSSAGAPATLSSAGSSPPPQGDRVTRTCLTCGENGIDVCDVIYEETQCAYPTNYCMNVISNKNDGTKTVERKCSPFEDVVKQWWMATSDEQVCQDYIPDRVVNSEFVCSFACTEDKCNLDQKPPKETLWSDK